MDRQKALVGQRKLISEDRFFVLISIRLMFLRGTKEPVFLYHFANH